MIIRKISRYDHSLILAVKHLLPQLSPELKDIDEGELRKIIGAASNSLFIAEMPGGAIAGMMTVIMYDLPSGKKCWIEDVVVDEAFRGKGIGKALIIHGLDYAAGKGAKSVDLTSRPSRIEANNLYSSLGFTRRETNLYRYNIV